MLTQNAEQILTARYLRKNAYGQIIETAEELFKRVAKTIAGVEQKERAKWERLFYKIMTNLEFLPNSPTLMNAGLPQGQLSACFVLPVEDSLDSIFGTLRLAAMIHQSGGGTGYNFSKLRPKGDLVTSYGGLSSGPMAFMNVYNTATESVKQGGKRRGANMGILEVAHSDIEAFIASKSDEGQLRNFNLSVGITDKFMKAVVSNSNWQLQNPRTKEVTKTLKASSLWNSIVEAAWKTGDPGLIFLDAINKHNPVPKQGTIRSTNPCGEVPLLNYESCNLGSLNLYKMLHKDGKKCAINWDKLKNSICVAMRFLDNVISSNHYMTDEIKKTTLNNRKVGLGVMGWAEMLIALDIPYASETAVELAQEVMRFIKIHSYEASEKIALERGNFPSWQQSIHSPSTPIRNATCNSIAPTGSISVIANTSYSIEPLYALAYKRVGVLDGMTQLEINAAFKDKMEQLGLWNKQLQKEVLEFGSIGHIESIPKAIRKLFETSLQIPWKYHLLHQQAFQMFTDNAVSKTINVSNSISKKEISKIYTTAWKMGLKGITIYRDGSKQDQVLQACRSTTNLNC